MKHAFVKHAFLVLSLAAALSAAAVSADASPASAVNSVNRQSRGDVNQDAELGMLRIQSLVSQRQQAIQTTTNMLSGSNGCLKCITQNIGR
jgi:hypothetical protein